MALNQLIQFLSLAIVVSKTIPLAGSSIEGGLSAVLEICKIAQDVKTHKKECVQLAEQASSFAVEVMGRFDQEDLPPMPELEKIAKQFVSITEDILRLLKAIQGLNLAKRITRSTEIKEQIQELSQRLERAAREFTIKSQLNVNIVVEKLRIAVEGLKSTLLRVERAHREFTEEQDKLRQLQEQNRIDEENIMLERILDPELSARHDAIHRVPYDTTIRGSEDGCLPGTRVSLLHEVHEWINSPTQHSLFWLCGLVGTGKTTIALTICKAMAMEGRLLACFFALREVARRRATHRIVATIAYQLALFDATLRKKVLHTLRKMPDITSQPLQRQVTELIANPLASISPSSPLIILIDALDECDKENKQEGGDLIPLLVQSLPHTVKLVVTSRPEPSIRRMMNRTTPHLVELHKIDRLVIENDIRHYLKYHLHALFIQDPSLFSGPWPSDDDISCIVKRSGLLFVYAASVVRFLTTGGFVPQKRLEYLLISESKFGTSDDNPFRHLDHDIYMPIVRASVEDGGIINPLLVRQFQLLVGTMVILQDPLSMSVFACLLDIDIRDARAFLPRLSSLLILPNNEDDPMHIFHLSFSDFITNPSRCHGFHVDTRICHTQLAICCLKALNRYLVVNICGIHSPSLLNSEVSRLQEQLDSTILPNLRYACRFWAIHLCSSIPEENLLHELSTFCAFKIFNWIEVMSLIHEMPATLTLLDHAQLWCKTVSEGLDSRFSHQLRHTERLVREFYPAIKISALHIYYSALAFAPQCVLNASDSIQIPGLPRMVSGRRTQWTNMFGKIDAHKGPINSVSYSPRGNLIISGSEDHDVRLWNSKTGEGVALLRAHTSWVRSVAFSSDEHWIVSGDDNGIILLWDVVTQELLSRVTGHTGAVNSVAFTPDSQRIISSSDDQTVCIWDRSTGSRIATLEGHSAPVLSITCSPDGEKIISGSQDSTVRVWCSNSGILIDIFRRHWGPVRSVAYSPTSHLVASGSDDRLIHLWNTQTGKRFRTLMGHMDPVRSVAFSSDGASLASGSFDSTIRIWDTATASCKMTFRDFTGPVRSVALSPNGNTALSISDGHSICIWDTSFGPDQQIHQFNEDLTGDIISLALSPSGDRIASSSTNEYGIQIRDLSTGKTAIVLRGHSDQVNSVEFSMDGQYILSGSEDGTIRVWDAEANYTGQTLIHDSPVRAAAFAPFGNRIASIGTEDNEVSWWQLESRSGLNARLLLQKHSDWVRSVAFSSGGRWVASGAADNTVCVWDPLSSHTPALVLRGHENWVECVAFSPDGRFLATGSDDCIIRVWDLYTGQTSAVFTEHKHSICSIAFSLDGQELISRDSIGIIRARSISIKTSSEQPKLPFSQTSTAWQNSRLTIPGYMVDLESGWVYHIADTRRAPERRCWLPPYRRPSETVPPVWHKDTLVTGAQSGIVSIIDFSSWQTNIEPTTSGRIQG